MATKDDLVAKALDLGIADPQWMTRKELEAAIAAVETADAEPVVDEPPAPSRRRTWRRTWRNRLDGRVRTVVTGSLADQRYERFDDWEQIS